MKERIIIIMGDDTPQEMRDEVDMYRDSTDTMINFSWDDEDNECMPATAKHLQDRYNVFKCAIL